MYVFGIVCVVLAVAIACVLPRLPQILEERASRRWSRGGEDRGDGRKRKTPGRENLQSLWEVEDIRNGILRLKGGRHRAYLQVNTPVNVALMSEGEQTAVEDALMGCVMALSFPVQFVRITNIVDTRRAVSDLAARGLNDPSPVRRAYANDLCSFLDTVQETKNVLVQETYVVVTSDQQDIGRATQELDHRCGMLASSLAKAGVLVERLSSEAVADLLHRQLNRGKRVRPSEVVAAGGVDLCVTGKGVPLSGSVAKEKTASA